MLGCIASVHLSLEGLVLRLGLAHTLKHQPFTFFLVSSFSAVLSPMSTEGTFIVPCTLFRPRLFQTIQPITLAHGQTAVISSSLTSTPTEKHSAQSCQNPHHPEPESENPSHVETRGLEGHSSPLAPQPCFTAMKVSPKDPRAIVTSDQTLICFSHSSSHLAGAWCRDNMVRIFRASTHSQPGLIITSLQASRNSGVPVHCQKTEPKSHPGR